MIETLEEIVGAPLALEELKVKHGRRRTVRAVGSRRSAIAKMYRSGRAPVVAARLRAVGAGPSDPVVPEVLHEDRSRGLVILSEVPGRPLREALLAVDESECRRAGAALGSWHVFWLGTAPAPLRPHTAERELEILSGWADRAHPTIAERVRRAAHAFSVAPEWPIATVVHRDLYEEQILLGSRVGLIDLDDAALGPAELDVGNLLAHVDLLAHRSGLDLGPAERALLAGYETTGKRLDARLLESCRTLARLRLVCIHGELGLLDRSTAS
jgi:Ser/Thr protein kinase RdoA (MazF antagonist)